MTLLGTKLAVVSNIIQRHVVYSTSSSSMAERPRELGDFKTARVNGGTNNHSLKDSHKCLRAAADRPASYIVIK